VTSKCLSADSEICLSAMGRTRSAPRMDRRLSWPRQSQLTASLSVTQTVLTDFIVTPCVRAICQS